MIVIANRQLYGDAYGTLTPNEERDVPYEVARELLKRGLVREPVLEAPVVVPETEATVIPETPAQPAVEAPAAAAKENKANTPTAPVAAQITNKDKAKGK